MIETNEEITQKLKQAIHEYFMGYIKHNLKYLLANGTEDEISNQLMQFLDSQIDTGNYNILKDDVCKILNSILLSDSSSYFNSTLNEDRISSCLPYCVEITIEDGQAAYVAEKIQTAFNGLEENSFYLYVSPEYYDKNIKSVEDNIKKLEKNFSKQDLKNFKLDYDHDFEAKQYELETAKVFESAAKQIDLKKKKFNQVSQKMINDYAKKYEEIISRDISDDEKKSLCMSLLNETKSYDERNHQAVLRLNLEYEKLLENFHDSVQSPKDVYRQMQNLHLFDKDRYFEDKMSSVNFELGDLYKRRYLLNSYRKSHNELVYDGKSNVFSNFIENMLSFLKHGKAPLMIGPHFEREYPLRRFTI